MSYRDNLGTEATLMLTFGKFTDAQPREVLPIFWRRAFFTDPTVADFSGAIFVCNKTESTQDISLGFMNSENQPVPSQYLTEILDRSVWGFVFCATLYAYIASGYEEMAIVKGDIQGQLIWEQDLADIDESTTWTLTQDQVTGEYEITKA
ncbi:hypothetical protein K503DRAFT_803364 [Rhizopogon vinicolor AM-OR11-026]|uniref:Uncharacterized protein n=1 Tax=Rhizopogon vinicolor AM-OR11-026 TaxID=1314800 RepID=A0A1B7MQ33_9AGAM|nr:hypothetical protein K503DRAFT_803364 [Rhizopogon vinicolor AM-OR11-026]